MLSLDLPFVQEVHRLILRAASAYLSSVLSVSGALAGDELREDLGVSSAPENGHLYGFGPLVSGNSGLINRSHGFWSGTERSYPNIVSSREAVMQQPSPASAPEHQPPPAEHDRPQQRDYQW